MGSSEPDSRQEGITFQCLVGHYVPSLQLDELTEIVELDGGARVRLCKKHGTAIAEYRPGGTPDEI